MTLLRLPFYFCKKNMFYIPNLIFYEINRNITKNVAGNKLLVLNQNALQSKILQYINKCEKNEVVFTSKNDVISTNRYKSELLQGTKLNELIKLIHYFPTICDSSSQTSTKTYLSNLDTECRNRISDLNTKELFTILHSFATAVPHIIIRLPFYKQALKKLSFNIEPCTKLDLLQLSFYVSFQKKVYESKEIVKRCLHKINERFLDDLTTEDLIIVCNCSFKTSTKILQKNILDKMVNLLYNNLNILKDATYLVTIVKTLRHNKYYDEELLATLSYTMFFNKTLQFYNFTANTHILALYADALYYDMALIDEFVKNCIQMLSTTKLITTRNVYYSDQIRIKDVSRFLWSVSYLGYEELDRYVIKDYIIPILNGYIDIREYHKDVELFINSLLSMWILGYFSEEIISKIVSRKTFSLVKGKNKRKFIARFNLLLACIEYENKELYDLLNVQYDHPLPFNEDVQIKNRPSLSQVYNSLNNIYKKYKDIKIEYKSVILHLNIIGIVGYRENKVLFFLECIDEAMSVKCRDDEPHGLMKLKLRLLKTFGKPVLEVYREDIADSSQPEVELYLKNKLKHVL